MGSRRELVALALQRAPSLRPDEKLLVWDLVADEAAFASLSLRDLESFVGRRFESAAWAPASLLEAAAEDAILLARIGARQVLFDDPEYPPLLRETFRPPFGLYYRGTSLPADVPCAAIVGTRSPTGRGLDAARRLAFGLAASGLPVVSGLARGIDAAAHRGAIEACGPTCAVLPCGPDAIYPPSNKELAAAILDSGGLLMTEYPPDSGMHKYRFPERNRIIAGVARACAVVEAPEGSGALITAEHALQEGRDVWVSAPCSGGPRSAGSDRLEADGARALSFAAELLEDWGLRVPAAARRACFMPSTLALAAASPSPGGAGRSLAASLRAELGLAAAGAELHG